MKKSSNTIIKPQNSNRKSSENLVDQVYLHAPFPSPTASTSKQGPSIYINSLLNCDLPNEAAIKYGRTASHSSSFINESNIVNGTPSIFKNMDSNRLANDAQSQETHGDSVSSKNSQQHVNFAEIIKILQPIDKKISYEELNRDIESKEKAIYDEKLKTNKHQFKTKHGKHPTRQEINKMSATLSRNKKNNIERVKENLLKQYHDILQKFINMVPRKEDQKPTFSTTNAAFIEDSEAPQKSDSTGQVISTSERNVLLQREPGLLQNERIFNLNSVQLIESKTTHMKFPGSYSNQTEDNILHVNTINDEGDGNISNRRNLVNAQLEENKNSIQNEISDGEFSLSTTGADDAHQPSTSTSTSIPNALLTRDDNHFQEQGNQQISEAPFQNEVEQHDFENKVLRNRNEIIASILRDDLVPGIQVSLETKTNKGSILNYQAENENKSQNITNDTVVDGKDNDCSLDLSIFFDIPDGHEDELANAA